MRVIADLHIHSKYARACSKELTPLNLARWADKKGIGLLGTADFTHPGWFADLGQDLEEAEPGLYKVRGVARAVRFMYQAEVASIYKQGEKVRRQHSLLFAPSREAAARINAALEGLGCNLKSDGRPILGVRLPDLVKLIKDIDSACELIPAHAWTPHFGLFGSLSGFDSLTEAFGDQTANIWAVETGLSSDPAMNWEVADLDGISLISNSDPHSLHRLGREANVLDIVPEKLSYGEVMRILRAGDPREFLQTVEFYPEEGRYHVDGHRDCAFSCMPEETRRRGGVCPVCGKQLLRGVQHRVEDLSAHPPRLARQGRVPFVRLLPLEEIIAAALRVGVASKKVQALYEQALAKANEFTLLLDSADAELVAALGAPVAEAVKRVKEGRVHIVPGYDGLYGTVSVFTEAEQRQLLHPHTQLGLF